ncbi:hypothetical protein [Bacteroides sp.]|uniref:hypothetical protein n=1 Tax=Bacteroides sp. TaxID=29523 RepID=UPI00261F0B25|nr:hypothetical protein [Bacteroides sp.]MDD3038889.1 hypothetical protein [Bacteroides sp.]
MIERLNQISLNDFIEISCGNYHCLLSHSETASDVQLKERASKLIIDYRSIVSPIGMKALLMDKEDLTKENTKLLLLNICKNLIVINSYSEVRDIFRIMDVDIYKLDDNQVREKLDNMLHTAIFEHKRNEERRSGEIGDFKRSTPEEIQASFDSEIAFLMTFFKINIDSHYTNSAVYANIVHQAYIKISIRKRKTYIFITF